MIKTSPFSDYKTASKFVRDRLGVSRLTTEQKSEVEAAVAKHKSRLSRKSLDVVVKPVDRIRRYLADRVQSEVSPLVRSYYRGSESGWAGGETFVQVVVSAIPRAFGESHRVWSRNGKWSGSNAHLTVHVMPGWMRKVKAVEGLATAGGMLTTHVEQVSEDCWKASWVRQARGFDLKVETGYIVKLGSEFFHGKTEASARSVIKRRHAQEQKERQQASLSQYVKGLSVQHLIEEYGSLQIKRSDSLKSGNCEAGTDNWIESHFPGQSTASVAEVLKTDASDRVLRAVRVAIVRQVKPTKKTEAVAV